MLVEYSEKNHSMSAVHQWVENANEGQGMMLIMNAILARNATSRD
jgi:hypothetical protein